MRKSIIVCIFTSILFSVTLLNGCSSSDWSPVPVPPYTEINGQGNYNNLGLSVSDGQWIYYSFYVSDVDLWGLYKVPVDYSTDPVRIYNSLVKGLNLVDDRLYFIDSDKDGNTLLVSTDKDGNSKQKICEADLDILDLQYNDDYFYFININDGEYYRGNIYRVKADGSEEKEKLSDSVVSGISVGNNKIYYLDDTEKTKKMNLDGTEVEVFSDNLYDCITIYKDRIYYINDSIQSIESSDLDGNDTTILIKSDGTFEIKAINIMDNYVYFSRVRQEDFSEIQGLFRISIDGGNIQALRNKTEEYNSPYINISSGRLFCLNAVYFLTTPYYPIEYYRVNSDGTDLVIMWDGD